MRFVGSSVHRTEDRRILTGQGRYIDDLRLPRMLHAAFVRSPMAHAEVTSVDAAAARALPGVAVAAASRLLRRPVKWTEDRNEHLLASGQAREEKVTLEAAVRDDGTLLGLRAELTLDQGAYPAVPTPAIVNTGTISQLLPGPYRWRAYSFGRTHVITNKASYVAYRGPWHIETWARERLLNEIASELDLDPAELRRRNYHQGGPDDQLISGPGLSGIATRASLDLVLDLIGHDRFRREQAEARARGRCLGLGFASYIESAPGPANHRRNLIPFVSEPAVVRLEGNGHLLVETAQVPQGQGHQTTPAQVAADAMGVPFDHVTVVHGDTRTAPFKYIGTGGSLSATWASGSVVKSARKVREKVLAIAAAQLEISAADLEITDGVIAPRGDPSAGIPLATIAMQALMMPQTLPAGTDAELRAEERFTGEGITGSGWSGGTHACTVEIDLETGRVTIGRYVVAGDCGTVINPAVVEGQIRGGVAQGIGQVLYERAAYDDDGNFLSSTFLDYLLPTAAEIPAIEIEHVPTEAEGEFGWRGVGEGGAIVAPATLTNAIADALAPFGARVTDVYLPPAKILELAGVLAEPEPAGAGAGALEG